MNWSEVFGVAESGLFVFEGQVDGQDKMDVGFVPGVDRAAGQMKREQLIRRQLQFLQDQKAQGSFCVIKGCGKIGQSEHSAFILLSRTSGRATDQPKKPITSPSFWYRPWLYATSFAFSR